MAVLCPLLIDLGSYNDLVLSMTYVSVICIGKGFTACAFLQPLLSFTFFCERDICLIFGTQQQPVHFSTVCSLSHTVPSHSLLCCVQYIL